MTAQILVVEDPADRPAGVPEEMVVHVDDYLTGAEWLALRNVLVINLCRSYDYLSVGYYCSLLAEARRHRVVPSVRSMLDLSSKAMYSLDAVNLDERIQRSLKQHEGASEGDRLRMDVFFGHCEFPALSGLARQIFETFPLPSLRVTFRRDGKWRISTIKPLPYHRLGRRARERFAEALEHYRMRRRRSPKMRTRYRYDLAILHNPADPQPPSNERALKHFIKAGRAAGIDVELIGPRDYSRLAEYDALFIRDTTRIDHYTYRFAKRAESEGMVVIDDPSSILRCTNKVYLAELLRANRVPAPRTVIAGAQDLDLLSEAVGYPMVLKVPDGSFSQGVVKAESPDEMRALAAGLLQRSELILAQEYLYTEFDWRIGILNRQPIYACQYFMSKKHWQIVQYDGTGGFTEGRFRTVAVEQAPPEVVRVALRAANLIGDGLYGVDVKQTPRGAVVIEVNDNPNIEAGVEDAYLKEGLYQTVMEDFLRRLELRRAPMRRSPPTRVVEDS